MQAGGSGDLNDKPNVGRKMLQSDPLGTSTLNLGGTGEDAGDSTAGVDGKAYGHGTLKCADDSHIEVC